MKFVTRSFTLLLSILLLASLLTCTVSAARQENLDAAKPIKDDFFAQYKWYTNKTAVGWSGEAITAVNNAIKPYDDRVSELMLLDDTFYGEQMELLHAQGTAAGVLTWIYYMDEELHGYKAVKDKYNDLMNKIDPAVNHDEDPSNDVSVSIDFFTAADTDQIRTVEDCYNEMIATVFQQKLENIEDLTPEENDSDAVIGILTDAVLHKLPQLDFRSDFYCYYDESDTENYPSYQNETNGYQALYDSTYALVNIQRNRENVTAQLKEIFEKLYPNDSFDTTSNEKIRAFKTAIGTKTTVAEMNGQLRDTVHLLLSDLANTGENTYRTKYLLGSSQKEGLKDKVTAATTDPNNLATITNLFENYAVDLKKADTKDTLVQYVTNIKNENPGYTQTQCNKLDDIVALYNEDDAILDASAENNIELELERAKRRLDLLVEYNRAHAQMDGFLGSSAADVADFERLEDELSEEYTQADQEIAASNTKLPSTLLTEATAIFADTVAEAEACAFENAHATILGITKEQIQSADENTRLNYKALLDAAIADVPSLSRSAIEKLETRTNQENQPTPILTTLGNLYKELVNAQIAHALQGNDGESAAILGIRADSVLQQQEKVQALPLTIHAESTSDLAALPDAANAILAQAKDVDTLLDHYQNQVDDSVKNPAMEAFCDEAAKGILGGTQSATDAIVVLNRMEAEEQIQKAAEGHTHVTGVQDIVDRANEDLSNYTAEEDIASYAGNAIFLINNRVAVDQMQQSIQNAKDSIQDMDFLDETQKQPYLERAEDLEQHLPIIQNATQKDTDEDAVNAAISSFQEQLNHLEQAIDCTESAHEQYQSTLDTIESSDHLSDEQKEQLKESAQTHYDAFLEKVATNQTTAGGAQSELTRELLTLEKITAKAELTEIKNSLVDEIRSYEYLGSEKKDLYEATITQDKNEITLAIDNAQTANEVAELLRDGLATLRAKANEALALEKDACCQALAEQLNSSYTPTDYSSEHLLRLIQLVREYEKKMSTDLTVEENEAIFAEAIEKIRAVDNLLQEAQKRNEAKLLEVYHSLLSRSDCYSQQNLTTLHDSYATALNQIRERRAVENWQQIDILTLEAIKTMQSICLDRVYTEDKLLADGTLVTAPDRYDPKNDSYIAKVEAPNGLPYDTVLTVQEGDDHDIVASLKQAAKEKKVYPANGSEAGKDLLKRLKDTQLCVALQIKLTATTMSTADHYAVSVLLPEELRGTTILGVVFLRDDGSVEFYEVMTEEDLICFETTHFSEFYVICENSVNLLPWIIVLSIIIACEVLALLLLYVRKNYTSTSSEVLRAIAFPGTLLTVYRPAGGVWILWILGTVALSLAGWITWLVVSELRNRYPETEYPPEEPEDLPKEEEESLDAPVPEAESKPATLPEPKTASAALPEPETAAAALPEPEQTSAVALPEPEKVPVLTTVPKRLLLAEPGPLPEVTVAEAEELMPDEIAKEELAAETDLFVDTEVYVGTKKAEINIDTISQNFESGDVVTLNALKEKKLVSKNTGHVKILARGSLNKPLIVIAQDFSTSALKMILLTGGTPIVTKPAPQRFGKR